MNNPASSCQSSKSLLKPKVATLQKEHQGALSESFNMLEILTKIFGGQ